MQDEGLVIAYTGEGKGKTTAAVGLALRFLGHGLRVCLVQFVKDPRLESGERSALAEYQGAVDIQVLGKGFIYGKKRRAEEMQRADEAWRTAREIILTGKHDLVILDEIGALFSLEYLSPEMVFQVLEQRPRHCTVCLTGRGIPAFLLERADLATEMREIRHPYRMGKRNLKGIDY